MQQKRHFKGCCRINIFCVAWIHCSQEQNELPEPNEKMQEEDGSCTGTGQEDGPRWEPAQAGQGAPGVWGGSCEHCHEKQKCNWRTRACMVRDEAKVGSENLEVVIGRWR